MQHSVEYNIGKYRLTINFWFLIIFLLIQTGLNELGFWQLSRAQEKQQILEKLTNSERIVLDNLDRIGQDLVNDFVKIQLHVELAKRHNILIENKIQNGELGYHVLNLVEDIKTGRFILVNRGWIEGTARRSELPQVKLPVNLWDVSGRVYQINHQVLSAKAEIEDYGKTIRIPVLDTHIVSLLEERFNVQIEPYLLRLDKDNSESYDVDWNWVSMSPSKHLGYAFQWFGLSLAFLIISLFVLIKKD